MLEVFFFQIFKTHLIFATNLVSESEVTQSYPTLCDPMSCSPQAPLFMGFPRQKYWSGLPCPPPGNLLNPGIKPTSPVAPVL